MADRTRFAPLFVLAALALAGGTGLAAPPEVSGLGFASPAELTWESADEAADYHVYRSSGTAFRCIGDEVQASLFPTPETPVPGAHWRYLIAGEAADGSEGPLGPAGSGDGRPVLSSCAEAVRHAVLTRLGYGWNGWSGDRVQSLGIAGYLAEQLDPASIDMSGNVEWAARRFGLAPPEDRTELQALQLVDAVYSYRQLEHRVAMFWQNHFNTEFLKTRIYFAEIYDATVATPTITELHYREFEDFRELAFGGSFREILGASARSPAMLVFLDTTENFVGTPNENYARELMELHTVGIDGGYTEQDVAELARVLTGWTVCKKPAATDPPLATCIDEALIDTDQEPDGFWVAHFDPDRHDCEPKLLFAGTAEETVVPATCGDAAAAAGELDLALDLLAAHPSTARFVSRKLLQAFVLENPEDALVDEVVATWNDPGNPAGPGDLRAVLSKVVSLPLLAPNIQRHRKIKTPFEHVASAIRAVRGVTNGSTHVVDALERMSQPLHDHSQPTGFPERGSSWIDTTGTLERQSFGFALMSSRDKGFHDNLKRLLAENGVSTDPDHAEQLVDFLAEVLFGGAIDVATRGTVLSFLMSDQEGNPSPEYDLEQIEDAVAFMLGLPQFQTK